MKTQPRYLVWGAGGHGRVVADLVLSLGLTLEGFIDADEAKVGKPVLPFDQRVIICEDKLVAPWFDLSPRMLVIPAIGDNEARLRAVELLEDRCSPALIHQRATVSPSVKIGGGSVVFAGAIVNIGAVVGRGAIVNSGAVVEHDCVVADGAHLSPGAVLAGGVRVGLGSWVGANATVLPGITIGSRVTIGAGAVVRSNIEDGATAVGVPARVIHRDEK